EGQMDLPRFELTTRARVQPSRSGRYALQFSHHDAGTQPMLKDLTTGFDTHVAPTAAISPHQALTSDGTVVYYGPSSLYLWHAGQTRSIATPETPLSAIIN